MSRSRYKSCLHQFLAVLKSANSGYLSPQSLRLEALTVFFGLLSRSHTLPLPYLFNRSLPHILLAPSILSSFQFLLLNPVSREWENEQNKACGGFEDHSELGDRVFVALPAGHIKRRGRARWRKGEQCKGKEVRAESSRRSVLKLRRGRGVLLSSSSPAFRRIQAELVARRSHPQPSRPLFVIWILSPPHPAPTTLNVHERFRSKLVHLSQKNAFQFMLNQADGNVCSPFQKVW